jgi:hypothetical protein
VSRGPVVGRSATWTASGSAFAAASGRDTSLISGWSPSPHRCNLAIEAGLRSAASTDRTQLFRSDGSCEKPSRQYQRRSEAPFAGRSRVSLLTGRQHQSLGEARCRPTAECQPQMADDAFQLCRAARPGREGIVPNRSAKIRRRQ